MMPTRQRIYRCLSHLVSMDQSRAVVVEPSSVDSGQVKLMRSGVTSSRFYYSEQTFKEQENELENGIFVPTNEVVDRV
jgi:hypothetical protein